MGESCIDLVNRQRQLAGYSTFVRRLQQDGATWFQPLELEFAGGVAERSERFRTLRPLLADLGRSLRADDPLLPSRATGRTS